MSKPERSDRLLQMEALLAFEGGLSRSRLVELFGLSEVRASEWLREFRDNHENWTVWSATERSWFATNQAFRDLESAGEQHALFRRYVGVVGLETARPGVSVSAPCSAFGEVGTPAPKIFSTLHKAIGDGRWVEITYRSMQNPQPHTRTLAPHHLVRAGRRWHVRGYCRDRSDFRDFALGRIERATALSAKADVGEAQDIAWNAAVRVRLVAHPALTPAQQEVIRSEYFGGTSAKVESCRGALVQYFIQEFRAATDTARQLPPDFQLAVENGSEIGQWLFPA